MRFVGMDYNALMADSVKQQQFKDAIRTNVAAAVAANASAAFDTANVQVGALSQGSVIALVVLNVPNAWSDAQVSSAANLLTKGTATVFSQAFLTTFGVTDITTTISPYSKLPPGYMSVSMTPSGLSPGAQAGIAVAVILSVLGAVGAAVFLWNKRFRATVGTHGGDARHGTAPHALAVQPVQPSAPHAWPQLDF